jgi:uncharacterized repeat protein (TIGR03803 family)
MHRSVRSAIVEVAVAVAITLVLAASGWAQGGEQILYGFTCLNSDGGLPENGLILDSKGNLYGTTVACGNDVGGTVFELIPNSNGTWTEQVLYSFTGFFGTGDGAQPYSNLAFDNNGNLYGTTSAGGVNSAGAVFKLSPGANNTWTETVLYSFGPLPDGSTPYAGVTLDASGNIYGTTTEGGPNHFGTIFELVSGPSGTWTEKILHNFTGRNDGANPYSGVTFDAAGNLYGMTAYAGPNDYGAIFQLVPQSDGSWTEHIVHSFTGGADGIGSLGNLVFDRAGNLYAATMYSVREFSRAAGSDSWTAKTLHDFTGGSDGAQAQGGLTFDSAGNLYGMTYAGGGSHLGTVFTLREGTNGTWTEKILHRFVGGDDGFSPTYANVTVDPTGNLYGTAPLGGAGQFGVVFEIKP